MADEAFGMRSVGRLENPSTTELHVWRLSEVDVGRRVESKARMSVLTVVPAEEALAEGARILDRTEAVRKLRSVLERLDRKSVV